MKIAIATDHAAFELKDKVKTYLQDKGHEVIDFGAHSAESMDYPDTIKLAAQAVPKGDAERAVVMCGSGIGASIVANKVHGIRAVLCFDAYSAEFSRRHNNANAIVFAGRRQEYKDVFEYLDIWLSTEFEGDRHNRRLDKITALETEECANE